MGRAGYPVVRLTRQSRCKTHSVHRLVAEAFLGGCPAGHEVNHKDRDRWNPTASNLEYVTRSENMRHSFANGGRVRFGVAKRNHRLSLADVREIFSSSATERALGVKFGVSHGVIGRIRRGQRWVRARAEIEASLR